MCGGVAVCTQVTCQSYDNESIPNCFGSYFGEEKDLDFRHFNGTRIWGNGNIRTPPHTHTYILSLRVHTVATHSRTLLPLSLKRWFGGCLSTLLGWLFFFFPSSELADEIYSVGFTTSQPLKGMKTEVLAETSTCRLNCSQSSSAFLSPSPFFLLKEAAPWDVIEIDLSSFL